MPSDVCLCWPLSRYAPRKRRKLPPLSLICLFPFDVSVIGRRLAKFSHPHIFITRLIFILHSHSLCSFFFLAYRNFCLCCLFAFHSFSTHKKHSWSHAVCFALCVPSPLCLVFPSPQRFVFLDRSFLFALSENNIKYWSFPETTARTEAGGSSFVPAIYHRHVHFTSAGRRP